MTQPQGRGGDFNGLAADYERYRIGYSGELFDVLETFGFRRGATVLDVGCGTGLSAEPLIARDMMVTGLDPSTEMLASAKRLVPQATFVEGRVERLPFAAASFDGAVSAQTFHWFDAESAFAELIRVVKPGGAVAVWWKILGSDEPLRALRAGAAVRAGLEPSTDPLQAGFGAFYRAAFVARTLRVIPFTARLSVADWLGYERSRAASRNSYGEKQGDYLEELRAQLVAKYGSTEALVDIRYTQFLYVGQSAR